jgi:hypothetical protein
VKTSESQLLNPWECLKLRAEPLHTRNTMEDASNTSTPPAKKGWGSWGSSLLGSASSLSKRVKEGARQAATNVKAGAASAATAVASPQDLARRIKEKAGATHEEFLREKDRANLRDTYKDAAKKQGAADRLPWDVGEDEDLCTYTEVIRDNVLQLSTDDRAFLSAPPPEVKFAFDFQVGEVGEVGARGGAAVGAVAAVAAVVVGHQSAARRHTVASCQVPWDCRGCGVEEVKAAGSLARVS